MVLTQVQQMRKAECEAAMEAYRAAGARYLDSLNATPDEVDGGQDLAHDCFRDCDNEALPNWNHMVADNVMVIRESEAEEAAENSQQ